jgi:hypothetical protein
MYHWAGAGVCGVPTAYRSVPHQQQLTDIEMPELSAEGNEKPRPGHVEPPVRET